MVTPLFNPETGEVLEDGSDQLPSIQVMTLEDAQALLSRRHGVAVGKDDPMLMLVTLHQGFLGDYEAMLRRHDGSIKEYLGATGEACAQAVEAVLASLKDKTVKASIDHAFALVERQALAMAELDRQLKRHRLTHVLLTIVSVASCVLVVAALRSALR